MDKLAKVVSKTIHISNLHLYQRAWAHVALQRLRITKTLIDSYIIATMP